MRKRLRSTIKWSGTVLTVLLLVLWVGSAWWQAELVRDRTGALGVFAGRISLRWEDPWPTIPRDVYWWPPERHSQAFSWWFDGLRRTWGGGTLTVVCVPIWVLAVLAATPTLWLWRRDRRRQPGLCIRCGYDLRGADHKVCPECGGEALRELKAES